MTEKPDANLIQMYCDGECSTEQRAQIERQITNDLALQQKVQQQISFQSALRHHLNRVSADVKAPVGMLDQVKSMLDQASDGSAIAGRIERPQAKRRRWAAIFEDPRRGNISAIAATVAIVAGAVLYGIFGRSIDDFSPPSPNDVFATAALFAEAEHGECAGDEQTLSRKAQFTDLLVAEKLLGAWVESPVRVTNLSSLGYEFVGAGQCNLPATTRSGHIFYRKKGRVPSLHSPMVSVFVFPNKGQCGGNLCKGMDCHQWYDCANAKCTHRALRSTDGRLVYLLVCCADGDIDEVAKAITRDLHAGQH